VKSIYRKLDAFSERVTSSGAGEEFLPQEADDGAMREDLAL
jgi:hypothetical protein